MWRTPWVVAGMPDVYYTLHFNSSFQSPEPPPTCHRPICQPPCARPIPPTPRPGCARGLGCLSSHRTSRGADLVLETRPLCSLRADSWLQYCCFAVLCCCEGGEGRQAVHRPGIAELCNWGWRVACCVLPVVTLSGAYGRGGGGGEVLPKPVLTRPRDEGRTSVGPIQRLCDTADLCPVSCVGAHVYGRRFGLPSTHCPRQRSSTVLGRVLSAHWRI